MVAQILVPSPESSLRVVVIRIISDSANHHICMSCLNWFHQLLNFHCNKYLLRKILVGQISPIFWYHNYRPQRSWAKVMFLQVCVILFTGRCLPQCMLGYHHPPGADTATPPQEQTPPWEQTHPKSRCAPQADIHPPEQTPPKSRCPPSRHTPPKSRHTPRSRHPPRADTPSGKQTPAYGQWAACMHPTGMHSCL